MFKITYTYMAFPPRNIKMENTYTFGKDKKGYYYSDGKKKFYDDLECIKTFFSPIGTSWEDVLEEKK